MSRRLALLISNNQYADANLVKLAARMGVKESGVRATSLNPRGDYCVHPDNYKPETQDRLVKSLVEILQTAEDLNVDVVLETHVTTTLDTAENIRRVIGAKKCLFSHHFTSLCTFLLPQYPQHRLWYINMSCKELTIVVFYSSVC